MKTRRTLLAAFALAGAMGWMLNGCSNSPLAPVSQGTGSAGGGGFSVLTVSPTGSVGFVPAPTATALVSRTGANLAGATGDRYLANAAVIDGALGGVLQCGRYTLKVPPGAYAGAATITMTLADSTVLLCDLEIAPLDRNGFLVPVELILSTKDLGVDRSTLGLFWYDPSRLVWVDLFAGSDPTSATLTAHLPHFSIYAAGKAGW